MNEIVHKIFTVPGTVLCQPDINTVNSVGIQLVYNVLIYLIYTPQRYSVNHDFRYSVIPILLIMFIIIRGFKFFIAKNKQRGD